MFAVVSIYLFFLPQYRRLVRLSMSAKQKERQMVKQVRLDKRSETKEPVISDVTDDVFLTAAPVKPVQVELEAPEPGPSKKKKKLTQLKKNKLLKRKGLR